MVCVNGKFASSLSLKRGDLVQVTANLYFTGEKYFHSVLVRVNGEKIKSNPLKGNDYWKTVIDLLDDKITGCEGMSGTQKLWMMRDNGVKITSDVKNVNGYGDL